VRLTFDAIFSSESHILTEEIKAECPWFFTMRDLIAERPNIIPTGIGNSVSLMDSSVLASSNLEAEGTPDELGILNDSIAREIMEDEEGLYATTGDEGMSEPLTAPMDDDRGKDSETPAHTMGSNKRKQEVDSSHSGGSNSKQRGPGAPKKTKIEEFAGIAASEEQTRQREIDLAKSKVVASAQVQVEVQKAKVESKKAKVELERMKLASLEMKKEYKMERMRLKHAREMAKINRTFAGASTHTMSASHQPHAGPSHTMSTASHAGSSHASTVGSPFYSFTDLLQSSDDDAFFGTMQNRSMEPSDPGVSENLVE
jgi:hypothetical protein